MGKYVNEAKIYPSNKDAKPIQVHPYYERDAHTCSRKPEDRGKYSNMMAYRTFKVIHFLAEGQSTVMCTSDKKTAPPPS